jgi:hypothetical protein
LSATISLVASVVLAFYGLIAGAIIGPAAGGTLAGTRAATRRPPAGNRSAAPTGTAYRDSVRLTGIIEAVPDFGAQGQVRERFAFIDHWGLFALVQHARREEATAVQQTGLRLRHVSSNFST